MLYPAQLYREELKQKFISCWYVPKYDYYFSGEYREFQVPENTDWRRDFVHLDESGHVDGYFAYSYNDRDKSMSNFGLVSFVPNGFPLIKDVKLHILNMFSKGANRLEFWAFADNKACKLYDRFIQQYGGKIAGRLRETCYFNGKYHDTVFYEILKKDLTIKEDLTHEQKGSI